LKRILLAIFDHNKDGMIDKEEFFSKVSKYSTKAPITTADIEGDLYTQKDKEDLVKMVNEDRREKAVYEDFAFDEEDSDVMARRKA
jgi:Ca2+-binding EF-hand superfamily protein